MKYILLDLDGTITNPAEGITKCFEYALNYFGIEVESRTQLEQFIGPPLRQSFKEGFGFDDAIAIFLPFSFNALSISGTPS